MGKCAACGKFLSSTGAATCSTCPSLFHKACIGISDATHVIKDWSCPECKKKTRKGDNSTTPVRAICGTEVTMRALEPNSSSPADFTTDIQEMRRELAEYMAELREYRKEMTELRNALTNFNERVDRIERRLEAVEQRSESPAKVTELEKTVERLKSELNDKDQEALLTDLEISNIPEVKGESVIHTVTVLASKLGVTLVPADIVFAERVGVLERTLEGGEIAESGRARRIVVRLTRRHLRDEFLRAARVRRTLTSVDLGAGGSPRRIYVNERLTRINRQLYYRVREECRRLHWRYSWTKKGRIFARQSDGKQAFSIRTEADMLRVFGAATVC